MVSIYVQPTSLAIDKYPAPDKELSLIHILDRQFTAEKLGFAAPCPNSLDGVSDRDFCIELANAISICMMHLSRLSEEIILWCSWEFKFIELDDAFTTGSSIMPQKKNPDVTELIRGKTGRVYGDLNTLLAVSYTHLAS